MDQTSDAVVSVKARVEALFDTLALEYVHERERQYSFLCQKRIALDFLRGVRGRLLEVGSGPAVMLPHLLALGLEEVHAIDISPEMVRRAARRMAGHPREAHCRIALGDVERLAYPDGAFDAVLCMGVLEYLPSHERALAEIWRVLRPGGVAVLSLPNRASAYHAAAACYERLRNAVRWLRRKPRSGGVPHNRCVPWKFDRSVAGAGLRKLESRACNFIFFPLHELSPRASESLNRALLPLEAARPGRVLGAQYLLKAEKAA